MTSAAWQCTLSAYLQCGSNVLYHVLQERAEVVKSNRNEVEGLFEKRSTAEQAFLERYMAAAEAYERQLEELRCADAEDYNLLKVRCACFAHMLASVFCICFLQTGHAQDSSPCFRKMDVRGGNSSVRAVMPVITVLYMHLPSSHVSA